MKITNKLFLSVLMAGAAAFGAMAQDAVTITVDSENGTLTRDGTANTWCNIWASNATNPGVTVTSTKNDMQWNGNYIDARSGSAKTETFTVAANTSAYMVQSYSFTFSLIGAGPETIKAGDKTLEVTAEEQQWAVTNDGSSTALSFTIEGQNTGVLLKDFTVTVVPNPDYSLAFVPTTIVDGEFAPGTNWYTIQIAAAGLHWTYVEGATKMTLNNPMTNLDDADLWCFTGDPTGVFQVYNKAAGPGKIFAAPIQMLGTNGGGSYAIVKEPGDDTYCYDWQLTETTVLGTDTQAYYMNENGYTAKRLNNRDNILAFWSAGADAGSAIQITWAEQTIDIDPATGNFYRDGAVNNNAGAWVSKFVPNANKDFAISTVKNNMSHSADGLIQLASGMEWGPWSFTCPKGAFVYGYSFDFKQTGDWGTTTMTITSDSFEAPYEVTADYQTLAVTGLTTDNDPDFTIVANPSNANKAIEIKNFTVTIRRAVEAAKGTMIFRYDGTPGYTVCYRIPTIVTVENGPHKGRVIAVNDYRYCGADIGAGRIDLYYSVSDDNGLTWSTPGLFYDAAGNPVTQGDDTYNADCAFGDAATVSDRESGKILMLAVGGHVGFFASRRYAPNQCFRWYSEDGGDTWTQGENITEQILSLFDGEPTFGQIDGQFFGSGRIMQSRYIKVGDYYRLYAVLSSQNNGGNTRNWCLYSDDFGKTWTILGGVPCVASTADEPKAEELPDGSVLLATRRNGSNRNFNIFRYTDIAKAEGSWGTSVATDMGMGTINACDGEIMILPVRNKETNEQCYMALQSFPYGGTRSKVSIAWKALDSAEDIASPSAFTTWNGRYQITKLGSAYSTMTWQHDNTLGFLYEESTYGKDYCGIYRNLTIEEITGDKYEYCPDEDGAVRAALTAALVDYRLETEAPKGEPGEFVGMPDGLGNPEAEEAAANYKENPTLENYLLFNKAITSGGGFITIKDGGVYTLKSAHNGSNPSYTFTDRWLTSTGSKLMSVDEPTEETVFVFVHHPAESENWIIYHPSTKSYIPQSPSAVETAFSMTLDPALAHEYIAESSAEGFTNLTDVNPGHATYATIHQGGNNNGHIVIWTKDSQASQWYMAFDHMATDEEMPAFEKDGISEITDEANAPVRYFDVAGREVAVPVRGQLLITSDRRKVVF